MASDLHERTEGLPDGALPGASAAVLGEPDWSTIPSALAGAWSERLAALPQGSPEWHLAAGRREVELLATAVPGPALAAWLDAVDPETLSDAGVVEATAAAARVEAAAHARTASWAAAVASLPGMDPSWSGLAGPPPLQRSVAGDELAFRLGTSRIAANGLVRQGVALSTHMLATGEALEHGDIDAAKTRVLVDRLWDQPHQLANEVEHRVLPTAARRTVTELRRDVEQALLEADPDGAPGRVDRARTGRRVGHPRVLPDGMASMSVVLPAQDAARVDGVLDHTARAARACGDARTLDQLRADGLRDLVVGSDAAPGDGPAWQVDRLGLGGGRAADLFRPVQAEPAAVPAALADTPPPGLRAGAEVRVTVAASTLLGLDDRPADLDGYGPVDAVTARALAAGGVWRRVVTDPLSGTVLDVGRSRYRPTAALAEHVRVRDRRCAAPGCVVPAARADLDHTRPFHAPPGAPAPAGPPAPPGPRGARTAREPLGATADHNLGPLCRRHHRLKTDGGYVLRQLRPGVFEWTTPTGHRYLVRPETGEVLHLGTASSGESPPF
ncbi:DUF222 domain-containing protein [Cellulomonas hominis]|uniref:DUF222 domain-containing protein n=1 Tax=Cellulomonas hominis TaxID=156981 RepID=UPI001B9A57FA|nr:DUF222 domain-containing protein [Cellulomonas hominis]VTR77082.1 hypothetical protein CHMI_01850 [Cellulomonas hominis]